jgi:hypothetical protein
MDYPSQTITLQIIHQLNICRPLVIATQYLQLLSMPISFHLAIHLMNMVRQLSMLTQDRQILLATLAHLRIRRLNVVRLLRIAN